MDWNILTQIISQLGFPIFVAIWMLVRDQKTKEELENTLNDLKEVINRNNIILEKIFEYFLKGGKNNDN